MKIKKNLFWHQHSHEFHRHVKKSAFCYRQARKWNEWTISLLSQASLASVIHIITKKSEIDLLIMTIFSRQIAVRWWSDLARQYMQNHAKVLPCVVSKIGTPCLLNWKTGEKKKLSQSHMGLTATLINKKREKTLWLKADAKIQFRICLND